MALVALLLPASMWAVTGVVDSPKVVLDRYLAHVAATSETGSRDTAVEIEASLPSQGKWGRVHAVRHASFSGAPEYEVLGTEGDGMVRRQVIARYLSAEKQSPPRAMVAITGANYKFRYLGSVGSGSELTYVYQITPRKKRVGLFRGELWIDAGTGLASHQSGRMVKMPSIFLRRIDIAQDMDARGGTADARITRLEIDTRVAGRARLAIRERPASDETDVREEGALASSFQPAGAE